MTDDDAPDAHPDDDLASGLRDILELIAPGASVTATHALAGGRASRVHRVGVTMPSGAATSFVLRRFGGAFDGDSAVREAETLEALRPTPVPAPELLWLDAGGEVLGRPAMAVTYLPGRATVAPRDGQRWAAGLADALTTVHLVPREVVPHLPEPGPYETMVAGALQAAGSPDPALRIDEVAAALRGAIGSVEHGATGLVHGDYHAANVTRDDDEAVTGIVDWTMAYVGDPLRDVGYAHYDTALLAGMEVADAFSDRYAARSGRDLSAMWWWGLLAVLNSLPDPSRFVAGHRDLGADLADALVASRAAAYVDRMLATAR